MTAPVFAPFGTYTFTVTGASTVTASKAEVAAAFASLLGLIPDPNDVTPSVPTSPEFGDIPPDTALLLRTEIAALAALYAAL